MFKIENKIIKITRGDIGKIKVSAIDENNMEYEFKQNDKIRLSVFKRGNLEDVKLQKDVEVVTPCTAVIIELTSSDTRLDNIINKPIDYWYEVQLNPDTEAQTIIGYDDEGAKIFRLYPEGGVLND